MTNITVGILGLETGAEFNELSISAGVRASMSLARRTGKMSSTSKPSSLAYMRRSDIILELVTAPISAWSNTSSSFSNLASILKLLSVKAPLIPASKRSRLRANPKRSRKKISYLYYYKWGIFNVRYHLLNASNFLNLLFVVV